MWQSRVPGVKLFSCPVEARGQRGKRLVALSKAAARQSRVSERSRFAFRGCVREEVGGVAEHSRRKGIALRRSEERLGLQSALFLGVKLGNRRSQFCFPKW